MKEVDRADFVNLLPHTDCPAPIGYSANISAPHMDAISLELLKDHLVGKRRALDIGSGSGYFTTLMSKLMQDGFVYGVDHMKELTELSKNNVKKHNDKLITEGKVVF